jgi:hypothetical protein
MRPIPTLLFATPGTLALGPVHASDVRDGGAAVGMSPTMTAWGHALSDDDMGNMIAFIRSLAD